MLQSMTGFAGISERVEQVDFSVEVRSVNNRYLKVVAKHPDALAGLEAEFESFMRKKITRGSVTIKVRVRLPDEHAAWTVNTAALNAYIDQLKQIGVKSDPMMRIQLGSLLELPGVLEEPANGMLMQKNREVLLDILSRTCDKFVETRLAEGKIITDDLLLNCGRIDEHLEVVGQRSPGVVLDYKKRLEQRIAELIGKGISAIDKDALAREVALFADRCDIAEEISRLTGHVENFKKQIDVDEAAGRKLDFIAQEMLREANTIASKANDGQIADSAIEIKTAINRIKEQVANVE